MKFKEFLEEIDYVEAALGNQGIEIIQSVRAVTHFYILNNAKNEDSLCAELREILDKRLEEIQE